MTLLFLILYKQLLLILHTMSQKTILLLLME